uniref:Uncharacterized protein n=1 Tax=Glossina brevipalpis TaxID=37001 RepID=A0A1A9WXS9_9MUSC
MHTGNQILNQKQSIVVKQDMMIRKELLSCGLPCEPCATFISLSSLLVLHSLVKVPLTSYENFSLPNLDVN